MESGCRRSIILLYPPGIPGYRRYLYVTGSCLREVSTQQKISNKRPLFCLQCELLISDRYLLPISFTVILLLPYCTANTGDKMQIFVFSPEVKRISSNVSTFVCEDYFAMFIVYLLAELPNIL